MGGCFLQGYVQQDNLYKGNKFVGRDLPTFDSMVLPPVSSIKPPHRKTRRLVYMLKKIGPSPAHDGEPRCLRLLTWESGQGLSISSPSSSWCVLLLLSLLPLHLFVVVEDFPHIFDNWVCRTGRSSLCLQCSCPHHRGEATWRCSKSICSLR